MVKNNNIVSGIIRVETTTEETICRVCGKVILAGVSCYLVNIANGDNFRVCDDCVVDVEYED